MRVQIDQSPRARNRRVVRRVLIQRNAHKASQRQRVRQPPGYAALRPDALEIPDQQRAKVNPRRQRRPPIPGRIELRAPLLDKLVEALALQQLVQLLVKRMSRSCCQLRVRDPQPLLLLPLLARAHRHRPILRTDPVDTLEVFAYESRLAPRAASLRTHGCVLALSNVLHSGSMSEKDVILRMQREINLTRETARLIGITQPDLNHLTDSFRVAGAAHAVLGREPALFGPGSGLLRVMDEWRVAASQISKLHLLSL